MINYMHKEIAWTNQWNKTPRNQQRHIEKQFQFGDYVLWFLKGSHTHLGPNPFPWFGPHKMQYCLPNNIVFLVNMDKFDSNFVLVNVNKLKSYNYAIKDGNDDNVAIGSESTNDKDHEEVDVNNV